MGKRSITSTKAGKFMNPTDQARKSKLHVLFSLIRQVLIWCLNKKGKEARRKELKKNKLQRQKVRQAVIKQKDPATLIREMELLDKMEFDANNPPPYSAKVIQDKRRKLKDQYHKILQYYVS